LEHRWSALQCIKHLFLKYIHSITVITVIST